MAMKSILLFWAAKPEGLVYIESKLSGVHAASTFRDVFVC